MKIRNIEISEESISSSRETEIAEPKWQEQYKRINRMFKRLEKYSKSSVKNGAFYEYEEYIDDLYNFFVNCYHLKDWLINNLEDTKKKREKKSEVESFINESEDLKLCADICNAHKHLRLDKKRSYEDPALSKSSAKYKLTAKDISMEVEVYIKTKSLGEIPAQELAKRCLGKWTEYLK